MKKNFFKIIAPTLIVLSVLSVFSACKVTIGKSDDQSADENKPYVVCTIFPQYDFVKNIAADLMTVDLLIPVGSDTHNFGTKDLSFSRIEEIKKADMIIAVGGESDKNLIEELKVSLEGADIKYLMLLDMIDKPVVEDETMGMHIEEEQGEDEEEEHEHGEEEYDEHVWTSPKRAIELVNKLTPELIALDEENGDAYKKNSEHYINQLTELDFRYTETIAKKSVDTLIFADRFPFRYLCHDYGISADAAFAGCSTTIDPAYATLEYLSNEAKRLNLSVILYVDGSNPKYAEMIAEWLNNGAEAHMLHSCHIVTESDFNNRNYISIMLDNLEVLKNALGVKEG